MSDLNSETPKTRRTPAPRPLPEEGWAQILAHAFSEFLNTKPVDLADGVRRVITMCFLVMLAGGTYILAANPAYVGSLGPRRVVERSLIERMADSEDIKRRAIEEMEAWFYAHRPHGLMLVSWEELRTLTGVWVKPGERLKGRIGVHDITADLRQLAGPFIFGECGSLPAAEMPGKIMVSCPIYNDFDVWGYVAAIVDPSEVDYTLRSMGALAHRLNRVFY